jgi:hypothetical protein
MLRLLFILLASLFLAPASALADLHASGDGSLVVNDANVRSIAAKGSGLIYGHIAQGTLTVVDYTAADANAPQISGAPARFVGNAVVYSGSDIRFLFPNGRYWLKFEGTGIYISAVGKGTATAAGLGTANDGTLTAGGGKGQALNAFSSTTASFGPGAKGSSVVAPATVASSSKGQSR